MSIKDRLSKIEYQLLKNLPFTPTGEQKVAITNSILKSQLTKAVELGEDLTDTSSNPTTFLGTSVTWDTSDPEGNKYTIESGSFSVTQDADDPVSMIINTADGINDAEAVALDKGDLAIGLGTNPDLQNVTEVLSFPLSGTNGTTVSWDASTHSAVDETGAVSQPANGMGNAVGTVTATISKGSESDTKTFDVTVLEYAFDGTEFITTWQTDATGTITSGTDQVKLPLDSTGTYNFTVDWGDGTTDTITTYNQAEVTHTYSAIGSYDIIIDGQCEGWGFRYSGEDNSKLTGIKQWGNVKLHNDGYQFRECILDSYTATDVLDTSNVTNMEYMFYSTTLPDGFDISGWDTSNITNMFRTFGNATLPTGFDISTWDTSSVTGMRQMFNGATIPTGFDISGWNTSSVTNMYGMFDGTTPPDGFDISDWDTSSVTDMGYMFRSATLPTGFDISTWDTSSVTNMEYMFFIATLPDGFDISGWDTSSVTDMRYMFFGVTLPDPFDLSEWNVTLIATEPAGFGTFNGTTQLQPIWGTNGGV